MKAPAWLPLPVSVPSTPISVSAAVYQTVRWVRDVHAVWRFGANRVRKAAATAFDSPRRFAAVGEPERVTFSQSTFTQLPAPIVPDKATRTVSVGGRLGFGSAKLVRRLSP